jgi:hypothetical protein
MTTACSMSGTAISSTGRSVAIRVGSPRSCCTVGRGRDARPAGAGTFDPDLYRIVLFSVVTTTRREIEWVTRDMGRIFPAEWVRFRDGVPEADRDGNLADAYGRLLENPDPTVREKAARDWCAWEDTHVATDPDHKSSPRYQDPISGWSSRASSPTTGATPLGSTKESLSATPRNSPEFPAN